MKGLVEEKLEEKESVEKPEERNKKTKEKAENKEQEKPKNKAKKKVENKEQEKPKSKEKEKAENKEQEKPKSKEKKKAENKEQEKSKSKEKKKAENKEQEKPKSKEKKKAENKEQEKPKSKEKKKAENKEQEKPKSKEKEKVENKEQRKQKNKTKKKVENKEQEKTDSKQEEKIENNEKDISKIVKKEEQKEIKQNKEEIKVEKNSKNKKFGKEKEKVVKEPVKNMSKNKKWIIPTTIAAIIIIILVFCSTIFALANISNDKIIKGVCISGIDVSGLSKEDAISKIEDIYQQKKEEEITIKYEEYETTLNPTLIEVNYEIEKAIEEAFLIGRKDNIFVNNYKILFTLIKNKNIDVNMTLNEEVTKQAIEDIGINLPNVIIESSYDIEEDELIITKGKAGIKIHTEKLFTKVKDNLKEINEKQNYIEIPVEQKEPEPINIDKIHKEVYKEAKNAYYTKDPFTIYPEVEGVDFDLEVAREQLKEEKEEYIIKLMITKPEITIDKIGSEAFPDQLATFTTRYDVSDGNRTTNLVIACQKINGKVVLAGETFSYNKALGPRTVAAGYRNGKIYSGGEVIDGIGGGICQISSTLYNTVLMSNLEIVERRNHQFVTSYLPAGRDATVVYGLTDFKFKNTRKYPIRIVASARNGIATVSMYGIKEENEYTFSFSTRTVGSIPFTTKYEEDGTLDIGTEKVKQKGANGLKTETYMTKMLNGKAISTTLLSKDTYDAMARIVIKGTNESITNQTPNVLETPVQPTKPETSSEEKPTKPTKPETLPTQDERTRD